MNPRTHCKEKIPTISGTAVRRSRQSPFKTSTLIIIILLLITTACTSKGSSDSSNAVPTSVSLFSDNETAEEQRDSTPNQEDSSVTSELTAEIKAEALEASGDYFTVRIDVASPAHEISPLIYGLSGGDEEILETLNPAFISWGGNPSSRYNWRLGNSWNTGSDNAYRNTDFGYNLEALGIPLSDSIMAEAMASGREMRLAVPTLGWVAKNHDVNTCSFPTEDGGCDNAGWANCKTRNGAIGDPSLTSIESTPEDIADWMRHINEQGYDLQFVAFDNEPELWGYTHYDVHPDCTTYQEILDRYLSYATAVQQVLPDALLTGPITCCWEFYWHSAAGSRDEAKHNFDPFIPWFLDQMRDYEEENGERILDVLDIHYYPEGVFNNLDDPETSAQRLRSTRSLWDASYVDESWIGEPIRLIPRMKAEIEEHYPGTRFGLSEWNWGADTTMNGALAIADVLGIFGREGLYYAAYWQYPRPGTPGFYAFQMYSNYDSNGSRFEGKVLPLRRTDAESVGAYAALDESTGNVRLMLVNRQPETDESVQVYFDGFSAATATVYQYDQSNPEGIILSEAEVQDGAVFLDLPAYSITLIEISGESGGQ